MQNKIYLCSSIRIDYLSHVRSCVELLGCEIEEVYFVSETDYRKAAGLSGIKRIWLRIQLYIFYPLRLVWSILKARKGSIFIVTSNTFYTPFLTASLNWVRGVSVVHLLYDLFPDAMIVAGKAKRRSLVTRIAGLIQQQTQRSCQGTVYLGAVLRLHCENLYGKPRRSEIIDVSADASLFSSEVKSATNPVVFHYGGQIGHMHDADTVIKAINDCWTDPTMAKSAKFSFFVSGAQTAFVRDSFAGSEVKVLPAVPSDQWRNQIRGFHVGLVTLKPGGAIVCLPSKAYSMMAGGLAIIAICPRWSDLAAMIEESDAGWVVSNSPYETMPTFDDPEYFSKIEEKLDAADVAKRFHQQVREILANTKELDRKRRNASEAMRNRYGKEELGKKWTNFLKEVAGSRLS
ncbi:hypothetical protein N8626_01905 [bacterium]|nr:hypothetical protein [bacterium]